MLQPGIEPWQNRRIEGLLQSRGVDRQDYYDLLRTEYKAESKKDLSRDQANDLIKRLGGTTPSEKPQSKPARKPAEQRFATSGQLKTLRYHQLACAVAYADLLPVSFNGEILEGEVLRTELIHRFQLNRMQDPPPPESLRLPATVIRHLFESWINPKSNTYLVEGKHKAQVRNAHTLYYDRLSPEAVQYLITRFRAMHRRIATEYAII